MQVGKNSTLVSTFTTIAKTQGIKGLYSGLSAAFLRQWTYGSCRMGIFSYLVNSSNTNGSSVQPTFAKKMMYGVISGAVGALAGTPSELALVRMGADSKLPPAERRNYSGVFDCIVRVAKEEGVTNLWRGASITIGRACMLTSCSLAITSEAKSILHENGVFQDKHGLPCMFVSTVFASFFATSTSMPFDVIKSRLQNMSLAEGKRPYDGAMDCFRKSIKADGVMVLQRGFMPAFLKLAPYTTISLVFLDKLSFLVTGKSAL